MKSIMAILFPGIWCLSLSAQVVPDTIYTIVNGNQVTIHHDNTLQNCCFMPDLENINIQNGIVTWYQADTMGEYCYCICYFNYSVTIDSLNPGNYTAMVYSVFLSDTTFRGATNFTIVSQVPCDNIIQLASDASICHLPTLVRDIPKDNFIILNGSDYITVSTISAEKILKISLISITGKEVYRTESDSFTELLIPVESLTRGIYILTIITDSGRYTRKIPIFR